MLEKLLGKRYFIMGYPLEWIAWVLVFSLIFLVIVYGIVKGRKRL